MAICSFPERSGEELTGVGRTALVMDLLHLDYQPPWGTWLRQIMTRLRESKTAVLRERMDAWGRGPLADIGLALVTKVSILEAITRRFDELMERLNDAVKHVPDAEIRELLRRGAVLTLRRPERDRLPYDIVAAVDAFFYEFQSAYEMLTKRFLRTFFAQIFRQDVRGDTILRCACARHGSVGWIESLRTHRNLFAHETAPWIALEVTSWSPRRFELVVLTNAVPTRPEDMIRLHEMGAIYRGFEASFAPLQAFVIERVEAFERAHVSGSKGP